MGAAGSIACFQLAPLPHASVAERARARRDGRIQHLGLDALLIQHQGTNPVRASTASNPSAHQPISPSTHQPISPSAHQPISSSAHQLISSSAHQGTKTGGACCCMPTLRPQPHSSAPPAHSSIPPAHSSIPPAQRRRPRVCAFLCRWDLVHDPVHDQSVCCMPQRLRTEFRQSDPPALLKPDPPALLSCVGQPVAVSSVVGRSAIDRW